MTRSRKSRAKKQVFVELDGEVWCSVPDAEGYEASNLGRVRSWRSHGYLRQVPKLRKPVLNKRENRFYIGFIGADGKMNMWPVHRWVLQAFVGIRPNGYEARHLDGNQLNDRLDNLMWGTQAENVEDKYKHGTVLYGTRNHQCKLSTEQVIAIRSSVERGCELAEKHGVAQSTISRIRNGIRRTHG